MGEEDDTVGGVADRQGPAGSGCERGGRGRGRGRRAGLLVGRSHGRVSWPARVAGLACGLSRPCRPARPSSFFLIIYP